MIWIAHRGASNGDRAENSLGAFERALEHFDGIELDLRQLADSNLVVLHDQTLKRTTEAPASVQNVAVQWLNTDEVTAHRFKIPHDTEECVPLYTQVLELLKSKPKALLFTELKDHHPHSARALVKLLEDHPCRHQVIVQSFDHKQLRFVRESSDLKICPLYQFRTRGVDSLDCEWEAPMAEPLFFTPSVVKKIQAKQRRVAVWFLFAQASKLARDKLQKMGVDGLMIDTIP